MKVISEPTFVRQDQVASFLAHDGSCVSSVFMAGIMRLSSAVIPLQPTFARHGNSLIREAATTVCKSPAYASL